MDRFVGGRASAPVGPEHNTPHALTHRRSTDGCGSATLLRQGHIATLGSDIGTSWTLRAGAAAARNMRRSRVLTLLLLALLALAGLVSAAKKSKDPEPAADHEDGDELGEADFWGVEVAAGKKVKVALNDDLDQSVHITQVRCARLDVKCSRPRFRFRGDGGSLGARI